MRNMTITVTEAGARGAAKRNARLSADRRKEIAQLAGRRSAEVRRAKALALVALIEKSEGINGNR